MSDREMCVNVGHDGFMSARVLDLLRHKYTVSYKKACNILKCNRSFIDRYIKDKVHYIYLPNGIKCGRSVGFNYPLLVHRILKSENENLYDGGEYESIYFNRAEFEQLIKSNMKYTRQTVCVPIEKYIKKENIDNFVQEYQRIEKDIADNNEWMNDEAIKIFCKNGKKENLDLVREEWKTKSQELISERKKLINDNFEDTKQEIRIADKFKRSKYQHIEVEMPDFDINELIAIHDLKNKDYGATDETIYRHIFENGYIKAELNITGKSGDKSQKIYYIKDYSVLSNALNEIGIGKSIKTITISYADFLQL